MSEEKAVCSNPECGKEVSKKVQGYGKYDVFLKDEQWLWTKYWLERLSQQEIARLVGCCERTVAIAMNHFNMPVRGKEERNLEGSLKRRGFHHTEETKRRIREANRNISAVSRKKRSERMKGKNNPMYGGNFSEEHIKKMKESHMGKCHTEDAKQKMRKAKKNPSDETRRKLREARKRQAPPTLGMCGWHHSPDARGKMREARKKRKNFPKHHTKPEMIYEEICKKYNLQYKYTGDGAFWIGKNPAINPDFVECNGKKIAIEIFSYWHDPIRRFGKVKYSQTYEGRKAILKQYGWELTVFWQEDLEREDAEAFVLSELSKRGVLGGEK